MANPDLTAKLEEERQRVHEQSQLIYLQGQIDELRRLLREQSNKYSLVVEQVRKTEAFAGQMRGLFERHAEETRQAQEHVRRDVIELRKEVAGALVKIEESVRPIRDLQSQIQQLAEARKQDREYVTSWFERIEQTERQIAALQSQLKELDDRQRQVWIQLERLREADAVAVQEARRVAEELQVEKQSLRRQAVEAQQLVTDIHAVLEEHASRIARLDDIRQHIERFAEALPKQISEVAAKLPDIVADIKRIEHISTERFLMNQERLEEIRLQADEKISALQEADEQHLRQLTTWLERIDSVLRELELRVSRDTARLEHAQRLHINRITEIERRELIVVDSLLAAVRDLTERIHKAQMEAKGEKE